MKIIVVLCFLMSFNLNFACECKTFLIINGKSQSELFIEDSFKEATIIFYGRYIGEGKFESICFYRGKKLLENTSLINEVKESSDCDYYFKAREEYLVFGKIDTDGRLSTGICYANSLIEDEKQLKFVKSYLKK